MEFTNTALEAMKDRWTYIEANGHKLVIDADTHLTDVDNLQGDLKAAYEATCNYYHGRPIGAEDILREMKLAEVDMALIWQNPAATPYRGDRQVDFDILMKANRYIFDVSRKYPQSFIPAGWTDPKALGIENALRVVDICLFEFGFPVVKMNPAQNAFPITSDEVLTVTERIASLGAVTAFHYGADTEFTPASGLEEVAQRFPKASFLAVHMGGGGAGYLEAEHLYLATREMGIRNPNIHFVVSAKRETHVESDFIVFKQAGEPYCRNISCGSDAPYGKMVWNFGGYRAMLKSLGDAENHTDPRIRWRDVVFTDEDAQRYLGGNFAAFISEAYRNIFGVHSIQP
ncbi:MAG: amidohydrolase family protein [Desulfobacterales bacterium]|nr:MAG: amidohydrolase family protein [Desulfobacterales bacterium]